MKEYTNIINIDLLQVDKVLFEIYDSFIDNPLSHYESQCCNSYILKAKTVYW